MDEKEKNCEEELEKKTKNARQTKLRQFVQQHWSNGFVKRLLQAFADGGELEFSIPPEEGDVCGCRITLSESQVQQLTTELVEEGIKSLQTPPFTVTPVLPPVNPLADPNQPWLPTVPAYPGYPPCWPPMNPITCFAAAEVAGEKPCQ